MEPTDGNALEHVQEMNRAVRRMLAHVDRLAGDPLMRAKANSMRRSLAGYLSSDPEGVLSTHPEEWLQIVVSDTRLSNTQN